MSFLRTFEKSDKRPSVILKVVYTKLEKKPVERNGFITEEFEFVTVDVTKDERKDVRYQHYAMCNLQALGVDGQLKMCVVAADNFKIADWYENLINAREKVSAENNQA